jgi:hypothetical protein
MKNFKLQIPNPKEIPNSKAPNGVQQVPLVAWDLKPWNLFGIWDLGFGI